MKKMGYYLSLLAILSACTTNINKKHADDLSIFPSEVVQKSGSDDLKSSLQPEALSNNGPDSSSASEPLLTFSQTGEAVTPFQLQLAF